MRGGGIIVPRNRYATIYEDAVIEKFAGLPPSCRLLLDVMCLHMSFARWEDCGQAFKKEDIIEEAAKYAGIANRTALNRNLRLMCNRDIIWKESNQIYHVNPNYATKGAGDRAEMYKRRWDELHPLPQSKYYEDIPFY